MRQFLAYQYLSALVGTVSCSKTLPPFALQYRGRVPYPDEHLGPPVVVLAARGRGRACGPSRRQRHSPRQVLHRYGGASSEHDRPVSARVLWRRRPGVLATCNIEQTSACSQHYVGVLACLPACLSACACVPPIYLSEHAGNLAFVGCMESLVVDGQIYRRNSPGLYVLTPPPSVACMLPTRA